jgi:hypothetical protein
MCERQLVFEVSEEVEGVREWEGPDRRYLGEGVRARTGARTTDSEWRQDAEAERELGPL